MRVIATAGHVDHGKSTLVWALTGTDPDRWEAEKARGMTIDLGFASTTLPSGREIGFVDVPGHGRFLKNMLAGVSEVDACLFVVAATEGWMAQSEEHLRILELFGLTRGVVALTKVGLVDDEVLELATLEVTEHLEGTFLSGAEVICVDIPGNIGLESLRSALDRLVEATPAAVDRGRPRLWIDRSFPVRGAGTVVTGTLAGGRVTVGDEFVITPGRHAVRVRGLQSHYHSLSSAEPGRRLAINLTGVAHHQVTRGHALVRSGQWHLTRTVDASLRVLPSVGSPLSSRGAFVLYLGSGDFPVRLRVLGGATSIEGGHEGTVRLWLHGAVPLPLLPGDRYILRELGRGELVGGGLVLDTEPVLPLSRASPSQSVWRVVQERGWVDVDHLERLTGERVAPTAGHWVIDPSRRTTIEERLQHECEAAGPAGVDLAGLSGVERAILAAGVPGLAVVDNRVFAESELSSDLSDNAARILAELERDPLSPPDLPLSDRGALRELEHRGLACQVGPFWLATTALDTAVDVIGGLLESSPEEGFTVSEARQALGISRKYALPLLAHFDATGITRRRGDLRVAGPRLPKRSSR
jgi:selenocysteine-specific elongation factor